MELSSKVIRWSGFAAMLGSVLWTVLWVLIERTEDGSKDVLGLCDGAWRRVTNVPVLLFIAGLLGFHARQRRRSGRLGTTGLVVALSGLLSFVAGNLVEYGLFGSVPHGERPGIRIGWAMCLIGLLMVMPVGLLMLGTATVRAKAMPRFGRLLPVCTGLILASAFPVKLTMLFWLPDRSDEWLLFAAFTIMAVAWLLMGYALWSDRDEVGA